MGTLMNPVNHNMVTMGQYGSAVIKDGTNASTPPSGKVFVAITMLADCTFDSADSDNGGLVAEDSTIWASTVASSTGSATNGQTVVEGITFPKGVTIYGRYTEIDLKSGTCIAYVG